MRRLVPALATLYLVWGSTYLAIRVMVEEIPPLLGVGVRFSLAGLVLLGIGWLRGLPRPQGWSRAALAGLLMVPAGNGLVCVASQHVPSGLTALVMATVPMQLVVWAWLFGGPRPDARAVVGLVLGFVGVGVLAGASFGGEVWALGLLVIAAAGWSTGSLVLPSVHVAGAWIWLLVMGSLVGGSVYAWALRNGPPKLVGTYAFVNPVVAVALGWLLLDEPVTGGMLAGAAVVLVGVILLLLPRRAAPVSNEVDPLRGGPRCSCSCPACPPAIRSTRSFRPWTCPRPRMRPARTGPTGSSICLRASATTSARTSPDTPRWWRRTGGPSRSSPRTRSATRRSCGPGTCCGSTCRTCLAAPGARTSPTWPTRWPTTRRSWCS
ncbi:MAG: EamA family transporter [Proteobacteria bacterium]|nr:EamA family transporter [Pseudomonadota bacterium]